MSWRINPITVCLWMAAFLALWLMGAAVLRLLGPLSLLVTALAGGVLLALRPPALRRRAPREAGWRCLRCGYDLRMSADGCPECGSPIPEDLSRRRRIAAEMKAGKVRILVRQRGVAYGPAAPPPAPRAGEVEEVKGSDRGRSADGGESSCS